MFFFFFFLHFRAWNLFQFAGLFWWCIMGNARRPHMPIISKRCCRNYCTQVFPGVFTMDVAESGFIEKAGQCEFRFSSMGSTDQRVRSISFNANHNASLSTTKLHI